MRRMRSDLIVPHRHFFFQHTSAKARAKAESRDQRAESREQRAGSREQRSEIRGQRSENREQRAEQRHGGQTSSESFPSFFFFASDAPPPFLLAVCGAGDRVRVGTVLGIAFRFVRAVVAAAVFVVVFVLLLFKLEPRIARS